MSAETVRCPQCRRFLPVDAFAGDRYKASGRKTACKACDNARAKEYYERNRERKRAYMAERNARRSFPDAL